MAAQSGGRAAYLGRLARVALSPEEETKMERDLERILEYVSQLEKVDTAGVEPSYHVLPLTNVMREDVRKDSLPVDEALRNAPDKSGAFFRVPKVL